jgi:hypothetical protein
MPGVIAIRHDPKHRPMKHLYFSSRSLGFVTLFGAAVGVAACAAEVPSDDTTTGGTPPLGVSGSSAGRQPGTSGTGSSAGFTGTSGAPATGGSGSAAAGSSNQGGGSGGPGAGGHAGTFGGGFGGIPGGSGGPQGGSGSGGRAGSGSGGGGSGGGSSGGSGGGGSTIDACSMTTVPSGGTVVSSNNKAGKAAGMDWTIWSNGTGGSITYYDVPAFSAAWNNSGDFLARIGLQWNASKTYDQYGTITAHFNYKKTGTGGGYSYIGVYGWSVSPCVEFYIVDDSYNKNMPVNPGSTTKTVVTADTIDGSKYTFYTRPTTGTGGSKCGSATNWTQFYSIRHQARQCGEISVSEHFKRWAAEGMTLGKMDQAQILVEVGGGTGTVDFTVASVTASTP